VAELGRESRRSKEGLDAFFEAVRMPLSGQVRVAIVDRRPRRVELDLDGASGKVVVPGLRSIDVTGVRVTAIADLDLGQLGFFDSSIGLGGPRVDVAATVTDLTGEGAFDGSATLTALPVAKLVRSWPPRMAPAVRTWISQRITAGAVRIARIRFDGRLDDP